MGAGGFARAITLEQAVADGHGAAHGAGHDAVLVVYQPYADDRQVAPLRPNARPVAVRHPSAGEGEVAHFDPFADRDEQGFALAGLVGDDHFVGVSDPLDNQIVGVPDGAVEIRPRLDRNAVAILRHGGRGGGGFELLGLPDLQRSRLGGERQEQQEAEE